MIGMDDKRERARKLLAVSVTSRWWWWQPLYSKLHISLNSFDTSSQINVCILIERTHTHIHTRTYIHTYIHIYVCVCVCARACVFFVCVCIYICPLCRTLLEKQGRTHKWYTLMDPHLWPSKSRTTSTNIHSATMWGYRMLSRKPGRGDER